MKFVYSDGGRAEAGFKGTTGDCAARALAIVEGMPYKEAYDLINAYAKKERRKKKSSARTGVWINTYKKVLKDLDYEWVPLASIGKPAPKLTNESVPFGRVIARLTRHYCAVVDHEIQDNHDPRDNLYGEKAVYGYWVKE